MHSPIIRELFRSLDLPPTAAGQLDWVTGTYRINRTVGEWRAYFANPANDLDLTLTLVHEMHHFLQISALSYLHRFASLLYYSIAEVVTACYNDMSDLPATLKANQAVRDAVWDLQWRGPDGVSVIDIVESLTHFIEVNSDKPVTTSAYVALLNDAEDLPDEYKRGFLYLYERGGRNGATAALFEILCHMSLCSAHPRECFAMLAAHLRSGEVNVNMTFDQVLAFCENKDAHHWGFAWDWRQRVGATFPQHPIFGSLESAIRDATMSKNFVKYLLSPHQFFDPFLPLAQAPPILFNPYPDGTAAGFNEWPVDVGLALRKATAEEKRKRVTWFLYMASASRKYLGAFGTPPSTVRPI
jgi:hypothetical protein